jgi:hypothetical protein
LRRTMTTIAGMRALPTELNIESTSVARPIATVVKQAIATVMTFCTTTEPDSNDERHG